MKLRILLGILVAILSLAFVTALPSGPKSITVIDSQRLPIWGALTNEALAGNVTQMNLFGSTITRTWQGYFGNITGMIVLSDSNNNTLYDWYVASPHGQIYAVRDPIVPSWESVTCASEGELIAEDTRLKVNESIDQDAVNRTFVVGGASDQLARFPTSDFTHPQFWVANESISASSCPVATMYNNTYEPSPYFKEVLLSDNVNTDPVTGFVIYTGIIAHSLNSFNESMGFDASTHDFEMIVGEDGHGADTGSTATTSTYYFYLELS